MTNCEKFLRVYFDSIGIKDYTIQTSEDGMGFIIAVTIPRYNNERIGILRGKKNKNLSYLKTMLHIIGPLEDRNPFLIIKID